MPISNWDEMVELPVMMMNFKAKYFFLLCLFVGVPTWAASQEGIATLESELEKIIQEGELVGLQVAVGAKSGLLFSGSYGTVSAGGDKKVDEKTLFLVASCSKPFASTCVLSLIADSEVPLRLDNPVSRWIPEYDMAKLKNGKSAERSPTVEELLCHRAGIYSQKFKMTPQQSRWIRDFRLSLEESIEGIAASPLQVVPGSSYAYSGAGYCVLGRVAELATGKTFESLLQERICEPLGMTRTTYFPASQFPLDEIATGSPRNASPHELGEDHRLPLIGGSLYTTAEEMTLFGTAISEGWNGSGKTPLGLSQELIQNTGTSRSQKSQYGLGWKVVKRNGKTIILSHSGSLNTHRAWLAVDLERGISVAGCWTLSGLRQQPAVIEALQRFLAGD